MQWNASSMSAMCQWDVCFYVTLQFLHLHFRSFGIIQCAMQQNFHAEDLLRPWHNTGNDDIFLHVTSKGLKIVIASSWCHWYHSSGVYQKRNLNRSANNIALWHLNMETIRADRCFFCGREIARHSKIAMVISRDCRRQGSHKQTPYTLQEIQKLMGLSISS